MARSSEEARAIALFREGRFAEAEPAFRAVLAREPGNSSALVALGLIAIDAGRQAEAIDLLGRAISQGHRSYLASYNLGRVLRQAGRLEEALAAFNDALAVNAGGLEAHIGVANARRLLGDRAGSRRAFEAALRIDDRSPAVHYNLALLDSEEGNLAAAEASLRKVVDREPGNSAAWSNLGIVLGRQGAAEAAIGCFERAIAADPHAADALANLGYELQRQDRIDEAIAAYARALEVSPGFVPALVNWGNALKDRGDLAGAMERYARVLAIDPREPNALLNSGSIELARGAPDAARAYYERVLEVEPQRADALYGLGAVLLGEHDFERGWDLYERRFETDPPAASLAPPRLPRATRDDLASARRIAVRAEQGLGDQILYSTLLPELAERGIRAVVEIERRLVGIYRRSVPGFEFVAALDSAAAIRECDAELPLGTLPAFFRRTRESFSRQPRALLRPDPERVGAIHEELGSGRKVGISWRTFQGAGRRHVSDRKSAALAHFGVLAQTGVRLVDLQYGDVTQERIAFDEGHPGLRVQLAGLDLRSDLEGVLAAIEACDLVVTTSNVTAHFAGALGKRTWVVYRAASPPFFYWAPDEHGRSLWYPSVEAITDRRWTRWEMAFEAIAGRIAEE